MYRYWISAQYFTQPLAGGGYTVSMVDKGTVLDLAFQDRVRTTYNEHCVRTSAADFTLEQVPVMIFVGQNFPTDTIVADYGFDAENEMWTTPLVVKDNCESVQPATDYVQAPISSFKHTEHLDRSTNNYELSGTLDSLESGFTRHRTISGSIHLDNLSSALSSGQQ